MEVSQIALARMMFVCFLCGIMLGVLYEVVRFTHLLLGNTPIPAVQRLQRKLAIPAALRLLPIPKRRLCANAKVFRWLSTFIFFLEDVLFCVLCAIVLILALYVTADGQLRLIAVLALAIGFLLYLKTVGRLILPLVGGFFVALRALFLWGFALVSYLPLRGAICLYHRGLPLRERMKQRRKALCEQRLARKAKR